MEVKTKKILLDVAGKIWPGEADIAHMEAPGGNTQAALGTWERGWDKEGRPAWVFTPRVLFVCGAGQGAVTMPGAEATKTGRARGQVWTAGAYFTPLFPKPLCVTGVTVAIFYGGDLESLVTPARIEGIIQSLAQRDLPAVEAVAAWDAEAAEIGGAARVYRWGAGPAEAPGKAQAEPEKAQAGLVNAEWIPFKGLGIIAASDKESGLSAWEAARRYKVTPLLASTLGKTTVKVLWQDGRAKELKEPQTVEDVRRYLASAFGGPAYGVLLALAYISGKANKETLRIKFSELSKQIFGSNPNRSQRGQLWEAIKALDCAKVEMSVKYKDPKKGKGEAVYYFRFVEILELDYKGERRPGNLPREIRLNVFPRHGGDPFSSATLAISEKIFDLPQNLFPLAIYLLMKGKHRYAGGNVKADLREVMQAAGLESKYKSDPWEAKKRLKAKIAKLAGEGVIGGFLTYTPEAIVLQPLALPPGEK